MKELLQVYLANNRMHHFEGESGVRNLEKLCGDVCGYDDKWGGVLKNFFEDNPGAIEAVVEWIGSQNSPDWKDRLVDMVGEEEENDDEFDETDDINPHDPLDIEYDR